MDTAITRRKCRNIKRNATFAIFLFAMALTLICTSCRSEAQEIEATDTSINAGGAAREDILKKATKTEALAEPVRILIPAWYRNGTNGPMIIDSANWQELYYDQANTVWRSGLAHLKTKMVLEECSGDSALVLESDHPAWLFFTGINGVQPIVNTIETNALLFPGHDRTIVLNDINYTIIASSKSFDDKGAAMDITTMKNASVDDLMEGCKQLNYKLTITKGDGNPIEIFRIDSLEFTNPTLIWAGDLNNDGLPDLLLDIPQFTESTMMYLYLSDAKDPSMPFKFVAKVFIQRDC